ncbi:hypothetical protein [Canibacter zhoujuaniae]|uniref:hypothetical protein n=1 Tax=Canibacter zhoujuaniae TaxID=2708343 RepID=UPI0014244450|nr:hypothetical protein [Canibacter zhoujuaniae]
MVKAKTKPIAEQHIAVFGTARSGKTTLLSAFYGITQEAGYLRDKPYTVVPSNHGEAAELKRNYTKVRDSGAFPEVTDRLGAHEHRFSVFLRNDITTGLFGRTREITPTKNSKPFAAMQLVWHDYPGEWLEELPTDEAERAKRISTLKTMLTAQVALLLIDGQKLADHTGNEGSYLREALSTYNRALVDARDDILENGKQLLKFPRIWVIGLSKADLLPDVTAAQLRKLILRHASDEIAALHETIKTYAKVDKALSVGEDYLLLSTHPDTLQQITTDSHKGRGRSNLPNGLEILLPLAAVLPFERHMKWAKRLALPAPLTSMLVQGASFAALALFSGKIKVLPAPLRWAFSLLGSAGVERGIRYAGDRLKETTEGSKQRSKVLELALDNFQREIEKAEANGVLLHSKI